MNVGQFLMKYHAPGKVIFAKLWGSRSHNTYHPMSDYDFAGVYIHPTEDLLKVYLPEEQRPQESWVYDSEVAAEVIKEQPDYQFHEAGKFAELLLKGNPGIIEMLFTKKHTFETESWLELVEDREQFLSQEVVRQYIGYMQGQLRRLINSQGNSGLHTKGGKINQKWVYHIIRLGMDAKRIAHGQPPEIWKQGTDRDLLMQIRQGEYDWLTAHGLLDQAIHDVLYTAETPMPGWGDKKEYGKWLDDALSKMPLPKYGNKEILNQWLLKLRKDN